MALLALAVAIVVVVGSDLLGCSPPSDQELARQEAFVRAHLADARDLRSGVGDCDDGGRGYVTFATGLGLATARDTFLADPACTSSGASVGLAVQCRSGRKTVDVFFTADPRAGTTSGSLELD